MRPSFFHPLCRILLLALAFAAPSIASAQLFHMETILESDGLPSPDIKSITQDRRGLMWVASRGGLAHHNGMTWVKADLDSITTSTTEGILETGPQGNVWALFSGNHPALVSHHFHGWTTHALPAAVAGSFQEFTHLALAEDQGRTVVAVAQLPNLLYISTADGWHLAPVEEKGIANITSIVVWNNAFILASIEGLFTVPCDDPGALQPLLDSPPPNPVRALCVNHLDNSLWVVGDDWIARIFEGKLKYLDPPQGGVFSSFTGPYTKSCQTDGFGGIYLSGIFSTEYFHPASGMQPREAKNGLTEFGTTDFFLDRELVLWQGTSQGIHKVISRYTSGYTSQQGLLADEVTALLRRRDGTLVVGHNNGLTLWNGQMTHLEFPEKDLRDRVLDLAEDSQGNVWVAGRQRGVGKLSLDDTLQWWPLGSQILNYTSSVLVDDDDRIWIATGDKLLILDDGRFREFPLLSHIKKGAYLRRLIKGRDDTIFVATGNRGVLAIKDGDLQQWTTGLHDRGNSVYDVLETPEGVTWVGTRNGLYQLQGDRLKRPTEAHFNFNRPVYFIEIDQQDRLWLGTDNGVIRIDGKQVKHLTAESGVIGRETNRCASLLDPDGRFWVGTERGLTIFNDRFENTNPVAPLTYLIELDAGQKTHAIFHDQSEITLSAQSTNLVFHYRVLTTSQPKNLKIRHRLDGLDSDWVQQDSPGEHLIRYANVPPGQYQFNIKAAGYGQPWSLVASSPTILIPAPVWQRSWFLFLALLAVLAMLTLPIIFIAQRRYTLRLQKEVKQQVATNLRIEAELEQARNLKALGLLAGGIAHDFNNLLTIIFGNLSLLKTDSNLKTQQHHHLDAATGAIERARGLTNQLLTFSKGGAPVLEVGSLANLVRESVDFVLLGSNTQCQFDLPDDLWSVVMDSGQMSQVVNNLLMNAMEAMPAGGTIQLSGRNLPQAPPNLDPGIYVQISVTDDGPGIDPEALPKIFDPYFTTKEKGSGLGLATAFSILDRHHGRLSVESTLGQGTTFQLLVPASQLPEDSEPSADLNLAKSLEGTVLLLDDDPDVRRSMGLMLESLGLQVEAVAEGNQALKKYRELFDQGRAPDIVLMDLTIPGGLGGQEIIAPLLEMDPGAKAIVISGYSHNPVISEYRNYGFKAAIAKPIMVNELGNVLGKVLAG